MSNTDQPNTDQLAGAAREDLCRLLAACYYQPEAEFGTEGMFSTLHHAASQLDPGLAEAATRLSSAFKSTPIDELLLDYTRLFLGPTEILAQPYGSVWLEGQKQLLGETTLAVVELYREGGFDIDSEFREVPDHVAAELEFLYLLIFRQNEAIRAADAARLASVTDLERRFLAEHLGEWAGPFAQAIRAGAQSAFYGALADLTAAFVAAEVARTASAQPVA